MQFYFQWCDQANPLIPILPALAPTKDTETINSFVAVTSGGAARFYCFHPLFVHSSFIERRSQRRRTAIDNLTASANRQEIGLQLCHLPTPGCCADTVSIILQVVFRRKRKFEVNTCITGLTSREFLVANKRRWTGKRSKTMKNERKRLSLFWFFI